MTTTVREQVILAVKAAITAIDTQPKIFRNRTSFVTAKEMPAVVIYDGAETIDRESEYGAFRMVFLSVDLELHVTAGKDDDLGPAINDLAGKCIAALMNASALNQGDADSVAIDTRYDGMDQPVADKADGAHATLGAVLRFQVQYQVAARDPTLQG